MSGQTASERVSEALRKAHDTQGTVNAFISIDDERATERAAEIDERLARGETVGPLAGVPIAVKDLIDHEGRVTTNGSSFYAETAQRSATCLTRLENAGAVIIGRTNLHEWAFGFNSENETWGAVRNPWDLHTSAGGSSGGSGAAVAAGIVPIAVGTDTGGSVRVPAALCGTFGLKVTHGRIPLEGVFPLVPSIDTVGPLAASMDGLTSSYRAMAADDRPLPEPGRLRIGIPEPWFEGSPTEAAVGTAFDEAVAALTDLGHRVEHIEMPSTHPSRHLIAALEEVATVHREFRLEGKHYAKAVEERIIGVEQVSESQVAEARQWQRLMRARFAEAFGTVDLLMTPTVPAMRKVIGEEMIGKKNHRAVLSYFTSVVNHALHPAIALPLAGTSKPGTPPVSLQLIGPLDSEGLLVKMGHLLEDSAIVGFEAPAPNPPNPGGE